MTDKITLPNNKTLTSKEKKAAINAVKSFCAAWKRGDSEKMFTFCTATWRQVHSIKGHNWLDIVFCQPNDVKNFTVQNAKQHKKTPMVDVLVHVTMRRRAGTVRKVLSIRLMCETGPYLPSFDGTWGVNPISAQRGLA